jgi:hypothetical protein
MSECVKGTEWVGYPMTICQTHIRPWPCISEGRRCEAVVSRGVICFEPDVANSGLCAVHMEYQLAGEAQSMSGEMSK